MRTGLKSPTITPRDHGSLNPKRLPKALPPTHPGEMLLEEFLNPLGLSQSELARRLGISYPRLNEIIHQKRSLTPDTALRLARVLGMSAEFWMGLQVDWDLWHAMRHERAYEIENLKPLLVCEPKERRGR